MSPQTTGLEWPMPGRGSFQAMFFSSLHSIGGWASGDSPVPMGPRQCGQLLKVSSATESATCRPRKNARRREIFTPNDSGQSHNENWRIQVRTVGRDPTANVARCKNFNIFPFGFVNYSTMKSCRQWLRHLSPSSHENQHTPQITHFSPMECGCFLTRRLRLSAKLGGAAGERRSASRES